MIGSTVAHDQIIFCMSGYDTGSRESGSLIHRTGPTLGSEVGVRTVPAHREHERPFRCVAPARTEHLRGTPNLLPIQVCHPARIVCKGRRRLRATHSGRGCRHPRAIIDPSIRDAVGRFVSPLGDTLHEPRRLSKDPGRKIQGKEDRPTRRPPAAPVGRGRIPAIRGSDRSRLLSIGE